MFDQNSRKYLNFLKSLEEDGWTRSKLDACLFKQKDNTGKWMYLLVYVDDILVARTTEGCKATSRYLHTKYKMTDFGRPKDFLGFEIEYVKASESSTGKAYAILHQGRYVREILEKYSMTDAKPIGSPWKPPSDSH